MVKFLGLSPYLYYDDAAAALEWLARVFGFTEKVRYLDSNGVVAEAEMTAGEALVSLCGRGPKDHEGEGQLLIVFVDDVDALYARVAAELPEAVDPPQDKPYAVRSFDVTDPWGYHWVFWQALGRPVELESGWQEVRAG
jgi:uncharacterized glyoxalase superfamily protein PhnB